MSTSMSVGSSVLIGLVVLAGLGLLHIWTSGVRAGRTVEREVREFTRLARVAAGAAVTALIIAGIQWAVVTHTAPSPVWVVVLGVPALLAGVSVGRLLAVTTVIRTHRGRRGVRRR